MTKIFGVKLSSIDYHECIGVYLIAIDKEEIAMIKHDDQYFLIGSEIRINETEIDCITRECKENIGYKVNVKDYICSAEAYIHHPKLGYCHTIQSYYAGELLGKIDSSAQQSTIEYLPIKVARNMVFLEMQKWAIDEYMDILHAKHKANSQLATEV